ncbi:MAG: GNAT family N-acetyltransferase [Hyphomicrobium sp.]
MAFLRAPQPDDYFDPIPGRTLVLRPPVAADYAAWAELRALSRQHLTPWEPAWSRDDLTKQMFRRRLRAYARDSRDDLGYAYFIEDGATGALIGGVTLSNVRRGAAQSCSLGYWIGVAHAGRGRMQEAVATLVPYAFSVLRLHRVEAASMPNNIASQRVLEKSGFEREGLARRYLKINGQWEDHYIYARVDTDSPPAVFPSVAAFNRKVGAR